MSEAEPVTVVIPCRNEAGSLPGVLAAIPSGYQVLVVDNGSDDGTASVATAHGAQVVVEPTPGYGAAVMAGVDASPPSIVCVLDGDGSMDPGELPLLVDLVRNGVDLAVGRRRPVAARSVRSTATTNSLFTSAKRQLLPRFSTAKTSERSCASFL